MGDRAYVSGFYFLVDFKFMTTIASVPEYRVVPRSEPTQIFRPAHPPLKLLHE